MGKWTLPANHPSWHNASVAVTPQGSFACHFVWSAGLLRCLWLVQQSTPKGRLKATEIQPHRSRGQRLSPEAEARRPCSSLASSSHCS